jgi:hypothetical protein
MEWSSEKGETEQIRVIYYPLKEYKEKGNWKEMGELMGAGVVS